MSNRLPKQRGSYDQRYAVSLVRFDGKTSNYATNVKSASKINLCETGKLWKREMSMVFDDEVFKKSMALGDQKKIFELFFLLSKWAARHYRLCQHTMVDDLALLGAETCYMSVKKWDEKLGRPYSYFLKIAIRAMNREEKKNARIRRHETTLHHLDNRS